MGDKQTMSMKKAQIHESPPMDGQTVSEEVRDLGHAFVESMGLSASGVQSIEHHRNLDGSGLGNITIVHDDIKEPLVISYNEPRLSQ